MLLIKYQLVKTGIHASYRSTVRLIRFSSYMKLHLKTAAEHNKETAEETTGQDHIGPENTHQNHTNEKEKKNQRLKSSQVQPLNRFRLINVLSCCQETGVLLKIKI